MPAVSNSPQRFMGLVRAVQKGQAEAPSESIARAASQMTTKQVRDFAATKHKGLPKKKQDQKRRHEQVAKQAAQRLLAAIGR